MGYRINRFNDFISAKGENFRDIKMWCYEGPIRDKRERTPNLEISQINDNFVKDGNIIFIAKLLPKTFDELDASDYNEILKTFDRLLEIYIHVEDTSQSLTTKHRMALLLATDSWEKMELFKDFVRSNNKGAWRIKKKYSGLAKKAEYPINIYFFHRNVIKYRAKCQKMVLNNKPNIKDVPEPFRDDTTKYGMYFDVSAVERMNDTPIKAFPKWKNPNEYYQVGNEGIRPTIDIFDKHSFVELDKDKEMPPTEDTKDFPEGKQKQKQHFYRERSRGLIIMVKQNMLKKLGRLECQACEFVFADKYGKIGKDYMEAHHLKPVSALKENEKTKVKDIALVCSNCHRMLHRKRPWIKLKDLKKILE